MPELDPWKQKFGVTGKMGAQWIFSSGVFRLPLRVSISLYLYTPISERHVSISV